MTARVVDDADALPEPPSDLALRTLPIIRKAIGERFVRIHHMSNDPIWFGWDDKTATFRIPTNRFDSPERRFGVLYIAAGADGAFAESVGRTPGIFRSDLELSDLRLATLELTRDLKIVNLHGGEAVGAMGATGVVGVGPQSLARRWSAAFHGHPEQPDGIEYRCRHNSDELALALFDRVGARTIRKISGTSLTADGQWLFRMRQRHHIWEPPS